MKVIVKIVRNDRVVSTQTKEINDDQLKYKRERGFNLEHAIGQVIPHVVEDVCKDYDKEQES